MPRTLFAQAAATQLSAAAGENDGTTTTTPLTAAAAYARPGLVVCATANITAVREAPPGQGGFGITFDPDHVALHQEKGLAAAERAQAKTTDYETLIGHRRSTLFDISAISGAAVSPLMGSATTQAYRILFTAANVRLGVWLPHPAVVRNARPPDRPRRGPGHAATALVGAAPAAAAAVVPLPAPALGRRPRPGPPAVTRAAGHRGGDGKMGRDSEREARLWAHVLRLQKGWTGKWSGTALWYRAMQPTLGLLWAEAVGRLSYRATWMYVTDGGHYDNLGLVEALRRGASNIVVLDASGDKVDTWFTLGGAVALARADVGVEIELDPTTMRPPAQQGLAPGQVVRPWAHGKFSRPQEVTGLPQEGKIWVCKLGWWDGAPWDVRAYGGGHSTYPTDSTLEQLYDATEFAAYQQLGAASVLDAAKHCAPPLPWEPEAPAVAARPRDPQDQPGTSSAPAPAEGEVAARAGVREEAIA